MTSTIIFENIKDFNLEQIFECGQCFRWNPVDDGSGDYTGYAGAYWCRAHFDEATGEEKGACGGGAGAAERGGTLTLSCSGGDRDFWFKYFDLGTDYSAIKAELLAKEPQLKAAIESGYGIRILNQDLWETIVSFIISQNNNIPRIKKCIEAICENYGERIGVRLGRAGGGEADAGAAEGGVGTPVGYAFPTPEALASAKLEDLAALKLGYRCNYLIEAGRKYLNCGCPSCMEELLDYLGIGPKVANCIRLFGLRELGAFPIDTWVKTIMNDMYGFDLKDVRGMQNFADEKFGKNSGIAQQYLFNYYRNVK